MQVRARRFVCRATFTRCISVCLHFSAILTEAWAKLGPEAYKTSKSPLWLNYNRSFYLRISCQLKTTKAGNKYKKIYTCFSFSAVLTGISWTIVEGSARKSGCKRSKKADKCIDIHLLSFLSGFTEVSGLQYKCNTNKYNITAAKNNESWTHIIVRIQCKWRSQQDWTR